MGALAKQIFVNMPVKDLKKTIEFFEAIGFEFNAQFTDEKAACMVIGEQIYAMLLVEPFFNSFTKKETVDTAKSAEVIVALSVESREKVDELVNKALAAGAKPSNDPIDHGFMYSWSFLDIDGHMWELLYMDESAVEQG
ncbi:Glyoxalase-like domain protein [compost metagenome]